MSTEVTCKEALFDYLLLIINSMACWLSIFFSVVFLLYLFDLNMSFAPQ